MHVRTARAAASDGISCVVLWHYSAMVALQPLVHKLRKENMSYH